MKLLLTNDDGVNAEGLHVLAKHFERDNEIIIAAPSMQRSGSGHSITTRESLVAEEVKIPDISSKAYSINGTPADCVRVGLDKFKNIDMVISGINDGFNLGIDVLYSGTVSAAVEASVCKVPSIAVSLDTKGGNYDYNIAAEYALKVFDIARDKYRKDDVVLNLNIPPLPMEKIKGIKVCSMGFKYKRDILESKECGGNTDVYYINDGYATLTPLHYDLTNYNIMDKVAGLFSV
ncbi:5'/3'-nucleotidase SurE [Clostridium luticellarii]|jgi:5'-nucleotidase|uniref:5'-nucleotidase SurE n=1 Tax=Clostridium luticellarii TaxID=1691940 RepID=A0A2T0BM71_9CLOT|nr:5'/3'-nucleotidase SurE [Clostridium luticellarii]MCI1945042.1 5'/3'-nucleotidase SurE [Clostridium luticellarii]MCI1967559.1 5'/3'-nucleotidase SurE [Clostridium luticellarii]MCI1995743.1 5'/3'-nucleotidase SurE [Clostridium luticellarii]MCI2040081.1 5'/3'-nucleotidase SurE [Clostridium luticellarii]PRR84980.1 5'/3'-nucleotidase SurE [Clostridium luticellarii]